MYQCDSITWVTLTYSRFYILTVLKLIRCSFEVAHYCCPNEREHAFHISGEIKENMWSVTRANKQDFGNSRGVPVFVLAYISPLDSSGSCCEAGDGAPQTALSHGNALQTRLHAEPVSGAPLVCSLTVHLRVHYICGSDHRSGPGLRQTQCCGCAFTSTSLCGSACRPTADPQIIIAIKYCFPNKIISLPLILCQSLFLHTSGHCIPQTALTQDTKSSMAKNTPCSSDETEMYELTIGASCLN